MRKEVKAYSPISIKKASEDNKLSFNLVARHEPEVLMNNRADIIVLPDHDEMVQWFGQ